MAIENVVMANIVGKLDYVNSFAKELFLINDIQLADAMSEIDSGRFTLPVTEKNIDELLGFAHLVPGSTKANQKIYEKKLEVLNDYYDHKLSFDPQSVKDNDYNADEILEQANAFIETLDQETNQLEFNHNALQKTELSLTAYSYLKDIDTPMSELNDMKYFSYVIGSLTKENALRLKNIYPSITSVIFHVGETADGEEVFMVVSENDFKTEALRILKALNFKMIEGYDNGYTGTPAQIIRSLQEKKTAFERQIEVLEAVKNGHIKKTQNQAKTLYNELSMLITINIIKTYMAFSKNNFYFSGWITKKKQQELDRLAEKYPDLIIMYESADKANKPPTKLQNNWLFRPFEQLVKMYGVPNYSELDPTPFLSITYILCFGFMFGDVGQGIVLLLGGLFAEKKGIALGGVVARISVASIIFGFLYGSFFGLENVLPTLWLKPMENTMTLLLTAVALGVAMLIIAYIYGLINKMRNHNIEAGWFGKNGVAGFTLYLSIILLVLVIMNIIHSNAVVKTILICLCVIMVLMVFFQEPMTNLVEHYKFTHGIQGEYYVSSFFEVFEMLLSMLSNTLSFIRVGAFALTHVGMFLAFLTLAEMTGNPVGFAIVLIIGNIFILGLEGLIDFIQCLRLEFYELFGKYYDGDGHEFVSIGQKVKELEYVM